MAKQKFRRFDSQRSLGVRATGLSARGAIHCAVLSCCDACCSHVETAADCVGLLGKSSFLCVCSVRGLRRAEHDSHLGPLDPGAADSAEYARYRSEALGFVRVPASWRDSDAAFEQRFGCVTPDLLFDSAISTNRNHDVAWSEADSIRFRGSGGAANISRSSGGSGQHYYGKYGNQAIVPWPASYLSFASRNDISLATSAALRFVTRTSTTCPGANRTTADRGRHSPDCFRPSRNTGQWSGI